MDVEYDEGGNQGALSMSMNGSRTNARRRPAAATSSSAASAGGSNERNSNNDGRRKKSHEPKGQYKQFIRRKGRNLSRIKRMCAKLGQLRIVDVVLFVGFTTKLLSVLYSRRAPSSMRQLVQQAESELDPGLPDRKNKWMPHWSKMWMEHKMPFHSPLLYRREDDDYSFGYDYDSYSEDTSGVVQSKKKTRYKGMFRGDSHFNYYKDRLHGHGYVVVDDVLYNADEQREMTLSALEDSDFQVNYVSDEIIVDMSYPAFEFRDEEEAPRNYIHDDDGWDSYYSFDDDVVRGTRGMGICVDDCDLYERDLLCTRPAHYSLHHPTCNEMHASLSGYQWLLGEEIYSRRWKKRKHLSFERSHISKYISHGYYRDAFLFQPAFVSYDDEGIPSTQFDEVVFKTMRHMYASEYAVADDDEVSNDGLGYDEKDKYTFTFYQEDMRKDAMVMELLSSSPRAINIYSYCAMSSISEFAPVDLEDYILPTTGYAPKRLRRGSKNNYDLDELPLNDYISPEEKLEIALEMAKCLAAMHGYEDGVLAHVDLQVGQFFRGRDGKIKIVDYNRAEPLLYNERNEQYCKWVNGVPFDGVYRAPEENVDEPLTEAVDVYSLGNVFYAVLTGKLVWEGYEYEERTRRIVEGELLEIPDFYYNKSPSAENLVLAIKACWTTDPERRPSIFEVVDFLERAVEASKR